MREMFAQAFTNWRHFLDVGVPATIQTCAEWWVWEIVIVLSSLLPPDTARGVDAAAPHGPCPTSPSLSRGGRPDRRHTCSTESQKLHVARWRAGARVARARAARARPNAFRCTILHMTIAG